MDLVHPTIRDRVFDRMLNEAHTYVGRPITLAVHLYLDNNGCHGVWLRIINPLQGRSNNRF